MTESLINIFQLIISGTCAGIALCKAVRSGSRIWILMGLFSGLFFMGDLYWQLFLLFYDMTPPYSYIPYMSWYASYLFLLLLLIELRGGVRKRPVPRVLIPVMAFTLPLCIFFMSFGDYISNIISLILMSMLIYRSADGLLSCRAAERSGTGGKCGASEKCDEGGSPGVSGRLGTGDSSDPDGKPVYRAVLFFCACEYGSWTASCFSSNIYYLFDILLSLCIIILILAVNKAAGGNACTDSSVGKAADGNACTDSSGGKAADV